MKNIIIVVLVVVVCVLGYFQFMRGGATNSDGTLSSSNVGTTDSNGKTIDLANKNLSQVSKDILDNNSVVSLDVRGNNLTGALPAEIRKLTNLETLNASNNKLTGIPAEIGQLSKLKTANFANNNISGLPLEIGNLKNLETLDLRGNPNVSKYDINQIRQKIPSTKILTD